MPSEVLGLTPHSWQAWNLDISCLQLGRWIESKLNERNKNGKPVYRLADLLRGHEQEPANEFASLKGFVSEVRRVPESGVW